MFRKPMRLEKWIAFDGAIAVDAVQAVAFVDDGGDSVDPVHDDAEAHHEAYGPDGDNGNDNDGESAEPESEATLLAQIGTFATNVTGRYDFEDGTYIEIVYPDESTNLDFPFGDIFDSSAGNGTSDPSDDIFSYDIYFEVTAPDGGKFILWDYADWQGFRDKIIDMNGSISSGWYAFDTGDNTFAIKYWNSSLQGFFDTDHPSGDPEQGGNIGGRGQLAYSENGALRFHLTDKGDAFSHGNGDVNAVFRSMYFVPDDGASPTVVEGYDIIAYYKKDANDETSFNSDDGGMYHPGTGGVTVVAEDGDKAYTDQGRWNNQEYTDPGQEIPPPVTPPAGGDGNGGDSGDGEDGGEGESESDNGLVFTYQEQDDLTNRDNDSDYGEAASEGEPAIVVELDSEGQDGVESAASAMAVDLMHEVEMLLSSVQGDRDVLLQSLTALQMEYLRRGFVHDSAVRDFLRELFERGDHEKASVNRVIAEMRRQLGAYNLLTAEQRDGMLVESLRELIDSAERRSGEMGALSRALEAVVAQLGEWHDRDIQPDAVQAHAVFARAYKEAMAEWQEKAERLDPMGRELLTTAR